MKSLNLDENRGSWACNNKTGKISPKYLYGDLTVFPKAHEKGYF